VDRVNTPGAWPDTSQCISCKQSNNILHLLTDDAGQNTPGVASLLTVVPQEQFASVLLLVRLAAAMLPTPKLAGVRPPACTGPLNCTCAVK